MPQIDKITFYHIATWVFFIYLIGYMYWTVSSFYTLCAYRKILAKYRTLVYYKARIRQNIIFTITSFPHIEL